jgi:hypothetical protein
MMAVITGLCRRSPCSNLIPQSLAEEEVCLEHFLNEAFDRADKAMEQCREGHPIDAPRLQRLLTDALAIVNNLDEDAGDPKPEERDRMLELLLSLANVHECAAHNSLSLGPVS